MTGGRKSGMRRKAICVLVVLIQARQGRSEKENRAGFFFILAALTFVNVPGVSRIAVKVKIPILRSESTPVDLG